ncbi:hypothetical protein NIES4071_102430 (plasmid) [Calothrix sp. NIES-4071]|nr:hypothetical protein NIES4071_102430 [Calothrix sp. NIES-4071]BAZ64624.1 hypothetical protein NIES4105_103570 [Calothrix sp. NIES-4105]
MISTQEYLKSMPFQRFTNNPISVDEAAFQTVCSQFMFFNKLRSLLVNVYGLLSSVTLQVSKLGFHLKKIFNYFSREGNEFDFSFMFSHEVLVVTKNLSVADHQFIGEKIRFFLLEVVVISTGVKEKYGNNSRLYILLKNLYTSLLNLRNSIVNNLKKYSSFYCRKLYYICPMSDIANSFAYQQSIVKALSLEVDLVLYNNNLSDATCLNDFP